MQRFIWLTKFLIWHAMPIDLNKIKTVYFIGIKGVGMSALAVIMKQKGYEVSGSDVAEEFITDKNLKQEGIPVNTFDARNLDWHPDLVVMTPAWGRDNPEVKRALAQKLQTVSGGTLLGLLMDEQEGIVVTGTHGKTTTTATLTYVLKYLNEDPSYFIGTGKIFGLEGNGHYGRQRFFVAEGDEYKAEETDNQPKFLQLRPQAAIITSIEMDHPDVFASLQDVKNAFRKFTNNIRDGGYIAAWGDASDVREVTADVPQANVEYYGFGRDNDWRATDLVWHEQSTDFTVHHQDKLVGKFTTQLAGKHSVLNALGIVAICTHFKLDLDKVKKALDEFIGSERRLEMKGEVGNILVYDDYAHHPTALKTTLDGLKQKFPHRKIWCVFQPHTFSRTKLLLNDFADSFAAADHAILTEVWGSAREQGGDVSSRDIVAIGAKNHPDMRFFETPTKAKQALLSEVPDGSIVITMGAGDIYHLGEEYLQEMRNKK
ncbi:UDP-N-acetylmuramate--L-alanine ligase [Patescibacteria group bacterium]